MSAEELTLTTVETAVLFSYERTIETGLTVFYEVGAALTAIRDGRLYRQDYRSFQAYCRDRWGMVASRARQLIAGAEVVQNLKSVTSVTPKTEAQCRPLVRLEPAQQVEVWNEATKVTANPSATVVKAIRDATMLDRTDARLEDEPKVIQLRVLTGKRVILEWALRTLELDLGEPDMTVVASIDVDDAEGAGYEVLESSLVERLARQLVKA